MVGAVIGALTVIFLIRACFQCNSAFMVQLYWNFIVGRHYVSDRVGDI